MKHSHDNRVRIHVLLFALTSMLVSVGQARAPDQLEVTGSIVTAERIMTSSGGDFELRGQADAGWEGLRAVGGDWELLAPADPRQHPCACLCSYEHIFSDGFESGNTNNWDP